MLNSTLAHFNFFPEQRQEPTVCLRPLSPQTPGTPASQQAQCTVANLMHTVHFLISYKLNFISIAFIIKSDADSQEWQETLQRLTGQLIINKAYN